MSRLNWSEVAPEGAKALYGVHHYVTAKTSLPDELIHLVFLRVSQINGCAHCIDLHSRDLRKTMSVDKITLVPVWDEVPHLFNDKERAALAWAEEVTNSTATRNDEIIRTVGSLPPGELAAFLAVAEHGGFRAASRTLGQTPSALSHAVAGLERRLKVKLFHRSTRNVSLTEPGRRLAERVMPALSEIGLAVAEVHEQAATPSELVRINSDANAAEQVLMPLLTRFMKLQPAMRFEIRSEGRLVDIAEGGFDCGVRAAELVPGEMVAIPIGPDQQHIVVASPAYLDNVPPLASPSDLSLHQCIQLRMAGGSIYRWEFQRRGEEVVVATAGNLVVDQSRLVLAAALDGCGLAYVTRWMAADALANGRLQQVLSDWTPPCASTTHGIVISEQGCVRLSNFSDHSPQIHKLLNRYEPATLLFTSSLKPICQRSAA